MRRYHEERFPFPSPGRLWRELRLGRPPVWMLTFALLLLVAAAVPPALVVARRGAPSARPRVHLIQDMGVQPRFGPQAASAAFADGRAMRAPLPGTVARGRLAEDDHYYRGYTVRSDPQTGADELQFFTGLPDRITPGPELLARGRSAYEIACVVCHGADGSGRGPLHEWAARNGQTRWVPPTSLRNAEVRAREDGHLYNTIRNGIRNMPPHADQLSVPDRWAVVAYLRHLQANAPPTRPSAGALQE